MAKRSSNYDPEKDVEICAERIYEGEHTFVWVSINRYDGGAAKIQISRENKNAKYGDRPKLGRLTYEEFAAVARTVKKFKDEGRF